MLIYDNYPCWYVRTVHLTDRHSMIMDENVQISSKIPPVHLILKKDTNEKYKSSFKKPSLEYVYSINNV